MVWDMLGKELSLWVLGKRLERSQLGQNLPSPACSSSKHKALQEPACTVLDLALCGTVLEVIPAIPFTDISKCSGFVCGRDLEETHHPGDHSDAVLPVLRLTPSAANVSPLCWCTKSTISSMRTVVSSALLAKSDVTLEYILIKHLTAEQKA